MHFFSLLCIFAILFSLVCAFKMQKCKKTHLKIKNTGKWQKMHGAPPPAARHVLNTAPRCLQMLANTHFSPAVCRLCFQCYAKTTESKLLPINPVNICDLHMPAGWVRFAVGSCWLAGMAHASRPSVLLLGRAKCIAVLFPTGRPPRVALGGGRLECPVCIVPRLHRPSPSGGCCLTRRWP